MANIEKIDTPTEEAKFVVKATEVELDAVAGEQTIGQTIKLNTAGKFVDRDIYIEPAKITIPAANVENVDTELGYGEETTIPAGMIETPITIKNTTEAGTVSVSGANFTPTLTLSDDGKSYTYGGSGEATISVDTAGYVSDEVGTKTAGSVAATGSIAASDITVEDGTVYDELSITPQKGGSTITIGAGYRADDKIINVLGIEHAAQATFANVATADVAYTEHEGPVLISGDYLYINEGYTPNQKISLADLVPDKISINGEGKTVISIDGEDVEVLASAEILSGSSAYNKDGNVVAGVIPVNTVPETIPADKVVVEIPGGMYGETKLIDTDPAEINQVSTENGAVLLDKSTPNIGGTPITFDENGDANLGASSTDRVITIPAGYNETEKEIKIEGSASGTEATLDATATASAAIDTIETAVDWTNNTVKITGSSAIAGTAVASTTDSGYASANTTGASKDIENMGTATLNATLPLFTGDYELVD